MKILIVFSNEFFLFLILIFWFQVSGVDEKGCRLFILVASTRSIELITSPLSIILCLAHTQLALAQGSPPHRGRPHVLLLLENVILCSGHHCTCSNSVALQKGLRSLSGADFPGTASPGY